MLFCIAIYCDIIHWVPFLTEITVKDTWIFTTVMLYFLKPVRGNWYKAGENPTLTTHTI